MVGGRTLGFALLGVTALAVIGAASAAVFASQGHIDKATAIKIAAVLAVVGEVCFWLGGGILGLSIIRRRKEALGRFFGRLMFWRRRDTASE